MLQRLFFILFLVIGAFSSSAHYTLHDVVGDVKIESGGRILSAQKGMDVKANDYIVIPKGGKVDIYNTLDKRIYSSVKAGKTTVTRLMIEARGVASDNGANVASRMQLGRKDHKGDNKVYVEKGMVRRSLAIYDPDGEDIELDAAAIGNYVASLIAGGDLKSKEAAPVDISSHATKEGGLAFRVENTLEFPVYFNIMKVKKGENPIVEISQLGQPAGSYVLLPHQTILREHLSELPDNETHVMVMSNCQYDIDKVIEEIENIISRGSDIGERAKDLPIYVTTM